VLDALGVQLKSFFERLVVPTSDETGALSA